MRIFILTLVFILLVIFGPLLSIWALNTLFPVLAIPYTFETWCAAILTKALLTVQVIKKD